MWLNFLIALVFVAAAGLVAWHVLLPPALREVMSAATARNLKPPRRIT